MKKTNSKKQQGGFAIVTALGFVIVIMAIVISVVLAIL